MASKYRHEVEAIRRIRVRNPEIGPYTLARRIKNADVRLGNDPDGSNALALKCKHRPLLSILSVIRRFDAKADLVVAA